MWEKQEETNLPSEEFKPIRAHFQLNLDKECVLGNEGTVKVIASIFGKKVQKIWMIIGVLSRSFELVVLVVVRDQSYFYVRVKTNMLSPALRGDLS